MNNIFSIKRVGFLFSDHILNKKNQYLLFSSIIFSLFLLSVFIHLFWRQDLGVKILVMGSSLAIIFSPFAFHLNKTESSYMLPASIFEKFFTDWIANVVFIPFLTVSIGLFCVTISCLFLDDYMPARITTESSLINVWLRIIGAQSVVLLGQSIFRKYILGKTMLLGILLFAFIVVCLKMTAFFYHEPFDMESSSLHVVMLKLIFIAIMWGISYSSLKKVQL